MVSPLQNYWEGRKGIDRNGFPLSRTTVRAGKGLTGMVSPPELLGGQNSRTLRAGKGLTGMVSPLQNYWEGR